MALPIKFPNDADVAAEEAARFRALSPEARMNAIRGLLAAGMLLMRRFPAWFRVGAKSPGTSGRPIAGKNVPVPLAEV